MPRVSTGKAKGRKLSVPGGKKVRPTTGRVKQSIFDTIHDFKDLEVLDIFAGSGALGIEALSRGAKHVTFIEIDPSVIKLIRKNLDTCGFTGQATILSTDYSKGINSLRKKTALFDLIFIDPPFILYERKKADKLIERASQLLSPDGNMIIEHTRPLEELSEDLLISTKKYGSNFVSFIRHNDE